MSILRVRTQVIVAAIVAAVCAAQLAPGQTAQRGSAVVYPVLFQRDSGSDSARKTAIQAIGECLSKAGYSIVSDSAAASTWKQLRFPTPATDNPPTTSELAKLGRALRARYVVYATLDFHSRSIWVNAGPKTISTVTVGVSIVDSKSGRRVYSKKGVQGRSDEKEKVLKVAAAVLVTPLVTAVSGGPKTPQEQRAAQIAVAQAMGPWVRR